MSRVSDTRLRTRQAASRLVTTGRRPHELTVDLIYADIKQGSRTTINDELKLWKDELAKADALTSALPPAVASAMLNIWAVAVEYGEKVFDQQREETETQLAQVTIHLEALKIEKSKLTQQVENLQADTAQSRSDREGLQERLASERATKEAAVAQASTLVQQLELAKTESEQAVIVLKSEHRQQIESLQSTLAVQERTFREEISKTMERLEGVQKHVMLQVTEAREAQKRAEGQLSKASQKNEHLSADKHQLALQLASSTQMVERTQSDLAQAQEEMSALRGERESLIQKLAMATGKLDALEVQIVSLEHRAIAAANRLGEVLNRPERKIRLKSRVNKI